MVWARLLAYVTGAINQELLLKNEYLVAENEILKTKVKGRLVLSRGEKATLAEIAHLCSASMRNSRESRRFLFFLRRNLPPEPASVSHLSALR